MDARHRLIASSARPQWTAETAEPNDGAEGHDGPVLGAATASPAMNQQGESAVSGHGGGGHG